MIYIIRQIDLHTLATKCLHFEGKHIKFDVFVEKLSQKSYVFDLTETWLKNFQSECFSPEKL